jgi:hypothetical protein
MAINNFNNCTWFSPCGRRLSTLLPDNLSRTRCPEMTCSGVILRHWDTRTQGLSNISVWYGLIPNGRMPNLSLNPLNTSYTKILRGKDPILEDRYRAPPSVATLVYDVEQTQLFSILIRAKKMCFAKSWMVFLHFRRHLQHFFRYL